MPNSRRSYVASRLGNSFDVADWLPATHPAMPPIVAHGRKPSVNACGFCHLPDGRGRPENAALAGLPAAYLAAQVADMRSGARRPALEGASPPCEGMRAIAERAPSYHLRQLFAFKAGTRVSPATAPMRAVASGLTVDDMIAAAAYVGSVRP